MRNRKRAVIAAGDPLDGHEFTPPHDLGPYKDSPNSTSVWVYSGRQDGQDRYVYERQVSRETK